MGKSCHTCKYFSVIDKPCRYCRSKSLWNPDIKKSILKKVEKIGGLVMVRIPVLDLKQYVVREQIGSVLEEAAELYEAVGGKNENDICEEALDLIQSTLGLLMMVVKRQEELRKQILRHELKLKGREANGGLRISAWFNMEYRQEY